MFWKQLWRIFQLAYAVPNVLRSLLFRPHQEVGKCFESNYEQYFSLLMQSLMFCEAYCSDLSRSGKMFWNQFWSIFQLAYRVPSVLRSLLFRSHHEVGKCFENNYEQYFSWLMQYLMFCETYCSDHITKWKMFWKQFWRIIQLAYAVSNVLRSLLFRPHHEVWKCFENNYEQYFSWLMQSLMFCESYCSDHITKWENVLETIMKCISVGLCSP